MAEETQEELMERVKNMSPEELLEFQKSRCIFCQIIAGKVQSKKVYDDDKILAILDINPANPGHLLLMPKEHYSIMPQVPEDILNQLFIVAKRLSQVALKTLGAKGTNILIQNGVVAGQKAQHFMIHMIPRKEKDGLNLVLEKKSISDNDYNTVMSRLKEKINSIYGIKGDDIQDDIQNDIQEADIVEEIKNVDDANKAVGDLNEDISKLNSELGEEEKKTEIEEGKDEPEKKSKKTDEVKPENKENGEETRQKTENKETNESQDEKRKEQDKTEEKEEETENKEIKSEGAESRQNKEDKGNIQEAEIIEESNEEESKLDIKNKAQQDADNEDKKEGNENKEEKDESDKQNEEKPNEKPKNENGPDTDLDDIARLLGV